MAEKKAAERFVQSAEGINVTNIPPENLAFILKQQEKAKQKKEREAKE